jgi:murein DD-endopeptidase MepM/ murein hydrolase activator NlpD
VQGPAIFTNDWGQPRPDDRTHQGTDVFGLHGSENVAVVPGTVTQANEEVGGLSVYLHGDDGHVYYYTHLSGFEGLPRRVDAGDVVGYTGNTGNAGGGTSHTHFEIHENGVTKINPYPTLRSLCHGDETGR